MTLRGEWTLVTLLGFLFLVAGGLYQRFSLAVSIPVWLYCSFLLDRLIRGDDERLEGLGLATFVTMLRGAFIALIAGFALRPEVAAPAYTTAVFLDLVDGLLARHAGRATRLGAKLDLELDALGIFVASLAGIFLGKLPYWYVLVGFSRYLFVFGIDSRKRRGKPVRELDPSRLRRALAGAHMVFLALTLWTFVPSKQTLALSYVFGSVTLAMFLRDWLYVSRRRG